jgi:serine phosphatase RsbU (regulator of sigma subunit)
MVLGILAPNGELSLARAGLPEPVYIPSGGAAESWSLPGPFLCTAETAYPTRSAALAPGDRLVIGSDGIRASDDPQATGNRRLVELAERHRQLAGQPFIDAVARDLLSDVRHDDDFTLMVMEVVRR